MSNSNYWYARHYDDYADDTAHLSLAEHGAYTLLLDYYYQKSGKMQANASALLRVCRTQNEEEAKAVMAVADEFFPICSDGMRRNKRADQEIEKVALLRAKRAAAGKEGGKSKQTPSKSEANAIANDSDLLGVCNEDAQETSSKTEAIATTTNNLHLTLEEKKKINKKEKKVDDCPHEQIIELYHTKLPNNPKIVKWTNKRKGYLNACWQEHPDLKFWEEFFEKVSQSKFLTGQVKSRDHPPFFADLEWLVRESNFVNVQENKYHREFNSTTQDSKDGNFASKNYESSPLPHSWDIRSATG